MHTKITPPDMKSKCALYQNCRLAANAAKVDPHCLRIKVFTVIKTKGGYTYVVGENPVLYSWDVPLYRYYNIAGVWSIPESRMPS